MKFSQRIGKNLIKNIVQDEEMDSSLKNRLFNITKELLEGQFVVTEGYSYLRRNFLEKYCDFFGEKITDYNNEFFNFIKKLDFRIYVNNDIWFFYDFIEWLYSQTTYNPDVFKDTINSVLEEEKSAYRFDSSGKLIKISDKIEIEEVNYALEKSEKYFTVSEHLGKAREAFSNREKPNYIGSVRESIFAVEALAKIIAKSPNATLESALKKIPELNINLKTSIDKLYHFRGDQGGIGHALKDQQESSVSEYDARLVLIVCHSIVNYLISNFLEKSDEKS